MTEQRDLPALRIADLGGEEAARAIGVLSRGMRDNPLHLAAFGPDPDRRRRCLERFFRAFFRVMNAQTPIGAWRGSELVGVTGIAPPGTCQPSVAQELRLVPLTLTLGLRTSAGVGRWVSAWAAHDPDEPHSHLGPLAVDAHLQGQGIGTQILNEYCRRLDLAGELAYLETDKPENVRLYERHGFRVLAEAEVIGVQNWFMRREPAPEPALAG